MFSVHSGGTAVHRTLPKGRVYEVYALACTQVYEVNGKVYGKCTQGVRRDCSLKTSSENPHFGEKFLRTLRQGLGCFQMRIDRRVMYSMVACMCLIDKAENVTATWLLPSRSLAEVVIT